MPTYWKVLLAYGIIIILLQGYHLYLSQSAADDIFHTPASQVPTNLNSTSVNTPITNPPRDGELLVGLATLDKSIISRATGDQLLIFVFFLLLSIGILVDISMETLGRLVRLWSRR